MKVKSIASSKQLIDAAFRKARLRAAAAKRPRERLKRQKSEAIIKIEASANYLALRLGSAVQRFPRMKEIGNFQRELIATSVSINELRISLSKMRAVAKILTKLKRQYIARVKELKRESRQDSKALVSEAYGRIASTVKSLDKEIKSYNDAAVVMGKLPSIKPEMPTAIIAGYPNTGKTTLLNRLTGSTPKIASYPFTTEKLQIGYFTENFEKVQVIDTPGLLDKPIAKRSKIEQRAIAALQHLPGIVVFVVDPTTYCGFTLREQLNLLRELKNKFSNKEVLVVLNKADIAKGAEIEAAREKIQENVLIEGKGKKSRLRKAIMERLGQTDFLPARPST